MAGALYEGVQGGDGGELREEAPGDGAGVLHEAACCTRQSVSRERSLAAAEALALAQRAGYRADT
eukprot:6730517-Alexandrium_andersonii.AAC.1